MTSTTEAETLPRWDLSNIYSGLEAGDYQAAVTDLGQQITDLEKLFDQHGIRRQTELPKTSDAELTKLVVDILGRVNRLARLAGTLDSFVYGSLTTNSYDSAAVRETSRLELLDARRKKVDVRLQGWIGSLAARLPALIKANQELKDHEFYLLETARQSKYLMPEQLEALAADMAVDAGLALGKLQGNTTSQLKVPFERNGAVEVLPLSPLALNTEMPAAAAVARIASMLCTSAAVVWSSQ